MCTTCGCNAGPHRHDHDHDHDHDHAHSHDAERETRIHRLEQDVLARNDRHAERNRGWLTGRGVVALNLLSSPGAGKTTLLERTLRAFGSAGDISVIEGDQATENDAVRIRAAGGRAIQINTGTGCHLEAGSVGRALEQIAPASGSLLFIENVGNLVCPALFDLGEHAKIVIVSVTEGDDKPLKYPYAFHAADACVLGKLDLLPHVPFDVARFWGGVQQVNPKLRRFEVSALRGDGLDDWYAWLREQRTGAGTRELPR